jgi:hypothetical protein
VVSGGLGETPASEYKQRKLEERGNALLCRALVHAKEATMAKRKEIIAACKKIEPRPEHGPGQYGRVIDHIVESDPDQDLLKMGLGDAVNVVMSFMS